MQLGGLAGIMLNELMRYINGVMDLSLLSHEEYQVVIDKGYVGDRPIEIGANLESHQLMDPHFPNLMTTQICLVLPYERKLSLRDYVLSFDHEYSLLSFGIFCFIAYIVIKRIANPRQPLTLQMYGIVKLLIGQALSNRLFGSLSLPEKILEVSTQIYNVVIVSLFASVLATALITGLRKPDIVDGKSFLDSGLRIMVYSEQLDRLFEHIPEGLRDRVDLVDLHLWVDHTHSLNDSYAYVMTSHQWEVTDFRQRRLVLPKLRLAPEKLCGVPHYLRFHVRSDLYYLQVMNHFLSQMHEAGFTDKWMEQGLCQAKQIGLMTEASYEPPAPFPLPLGFFIKSLKLYAYGLLLSLVALLVECIYFWRTNNRNDVIIV